MTQTLQASRLSLYDVVQQFHLQEVKDTLFFQEIADVQIELTDRDKQDLDLIKEEYLYLAQRPMIEDLVKMVRSQYALSRRFSLYDADNALYDVLRILKYLGQLTISGYASDAEVG